MPGSNSNVLALPQTRPGECDLDVRYVVPRVLYTAYQEIPESSCVRSLASDVAITRLKGKLTEMDVYDDHGPSHF